MQLPSVRFGQSSLTQGQKTRFQGTLLPPSGGDTVQFGHGNPKQNESVVRASVEKEARRLKRNGKLPDGMTVQEFVENKMAERGQRDRRK